ncbi:MAG: response regulator [Bacteroidota bacterium]
MDRIYRNREILIVDDQQAEIVLLRQGLIDLGFSGKINSLSRGDEVMPYLLQENTPAEERRLQLPRVMFLDLSMPGMDGFVVLETVKTHPITARLPVIIFSNSDRPEDFAQANASGAGGYIVKPVHYEDLLNRLRNILDFWMQQDVR